MCQNAKLLLLVTNCQVVGVYVWTAEDKIKLERKRVILVQSKVDTTQERVVSVIHVFFLNFFIGQCRKLLFAQFLFDFVRERALGTVIYGTWEKESKSLSFPPLVI